MNASNQYCEALGIEVPNLETACRSLDASWYSLLIAALLERGEPITLQQAAERFEEAGIAPIEQALASLKRCRPARPPIYRDGDLYALDPYDDEADLWAFRLGLRPPKVSLPRVARPDPVPLPALEEPLTVPQLDEAWREGVPFSWSAQRIAICVLDCHGGAMRPGEVLDFVGKRSRWSQLARDSDRYWRTGAPIRVDEDGMWELDRGHPAVASARRAVRERMEMFRRRAAQAPDPAALEASRERLERERQAHAELLAGMKRALIYGFPAGRPEALVLLDVGRHQIDTYLGEQIATATARLADFDIIAALDVRVLLKCLGFEPGRRRLADLGPPQKTKRLNRRGRTLKITTKLLIQGSCGISSPFGDREILDRYLRDGAHTRLRRRLEADAKALFALYQYGRLHGAVRLRWGFLDEWIPAPWVHRDEPTLGTLKQQALEQQVPLEVVIGTAPGWTDPWSRARLVRVMKGKDRWWSWLVDEQGYVVNEADVQLARLARAGR